MDDAGDEPIFVEDGAVVFEEHHEEVVDRAKFGVDGSVQGFNLNLGLAGAVHLEAVGEDEAAKAG